MEPGQHLLPRFFFVRAMRIALTIPGLLLLLLPLFAGTAAAQSADLAARSRTASRAMSEGRFDEAARIYRELLKALPDDPGLLMNLGMALAMGGEEKQAVAPLERAISLKPDMIPAHLFLGSSYLALGDGPKAIPPLQRAVRGAPADADRRRMLAQAYTAAGRHVDAVTELRRITELEPRLPGGWYALGHAYNALGQEAMATFADGRDDSPWQQLLVADALLADGRFNDAFALYRETLEQLPSMVTVHDSVARIYEETGHPDWAAKERARGALSAAGCARRKALCEFRAGRHRPALVASLAASDPESRYWRVRAATELARAAFKRLDALPDSRERREVRATLAFAERRYTDAIAELQAALKFAPHDPALVDDLGTAYYFARDYEKAIDTLSPLLAANTADARLLTLYGDSLLQLQRVDEALPILKRAVQSGTTESSARLTLARAHLQKGDFGAAIPLIEPHLAEDEDGSLHVQLARAYTGLDQPEKAEALLKRSQELQQAEQKRNATAGERTITPPK